MKKILVADSSESNDLILREIFADQYEYIKISDSEDFCHTIIENKDDFAVALINKNIADTLSYDAIQQLIDNKVLDVIPVIIVVNEDDSIEKMEFPYSDVIRLPFDSDAARKRVQTLSNIFLSKEKYKHMLKQQTDRVIELNQFITHLQEKLHNIHNDMLNSLGSIVEFRDTESGKHIHRIRKFTEVLLETLAKDYPKYDLTSKKIAMIASASSLHDIGKITIPDSILLSPRRLTFDEFKIMKLHTVRGCEILERQFKIMNEYLAIENPVSDNTDYVEQNEYYKYCYEICRYHHEKYDGMGYPDGLVGDEIPIWSQVVALADCYDALTSERSYKAAFPHEKAVDMIRSGACGAFSDEMMDCFSKVLPKFKELAKKYADVNNEDSSISGREDRKYIEEDEIDHSKDVYFKMDRDDLINTIENQKKLMVQTHKRDCEIIYNASDYVFEFDLVQGICHERKGYFTEKVGYVPKNYEEAIHLISQSCSEEYQNKFIRTFRLDNVRSETEKGKTRVTLECFMKLEGSDYSSVRCTVIPIVDDHKIIRLIGSVIVLNNAVLPQSTDNLYRDHDLVTGLWNYEGMKKETNDFLEHNGRNGYHMLMVIDIDNFRSLNRHTGFHFGNELLKDIAVFLKRESAEGSFVGKIEDDNFLLFIKDCPKDEEKVAVVDSIFKCLHRSYTFNNKTYPEISACIGVASYPSDGQRFEELYANASAAVDVAKINGKDMYLFYHENMKKSWEIKKFSAVPEVFHDKSLDTIDFDKCFIPVIDSESGNVISYDLIETDKENDTDPDYVYEYDYDDDNVTAFSLNSMKRLIAAIDSLSEETAVPKLAIMTMFNGRDSETILKAIGQMLMQNPIATENIYLMLSQNMLKNMELNSLAAFIGGLKSFGFKVGVYNIGTQNINIKCFADKLFDRICFSKSFLEDIDNGIYPTDLMVYFVNYFSSLGTETVMPANISSDIAEIIKQKANVPFGIRRQEKIRYDDFIDQMKATVILNQYPVLSHENNALVINDKMYDEILEQTRSFILEWSPRTDSIKISDSFQKMYGYVPEQSNFIRNIRDRNFVHNDDVNKLIEKLNASRSESNVSDCLVRVYRSNDESYLWNRVSFVTVRNDTGIPVRVIAIFADITDEENAAENEHRKDRTDFITNLYNKKATENKIKTYLYDEGAAGYHALITAEMYGYDKIEENLGAVFANAVLKEVAQNIRELFRDSDIIGRSSGNSFTVFVKNISDKDKIRQKAEQICEAIHNQYQSENGDIKIYGKAGISLFPQNGKTYDELYSNALQALYYAKHKVTGNSAFSASFDSDVKLLHD